ncbi:MAG: hypothetical protein ABIG70_03450 [Pseudomonadota bacterium]
MQTMNLEQLRASTEAGGVLGVTLKAEGAAFYVNIETRRGEAVMVKAKSKEPRKFADPRKAMLVLRELGIRELRIDGSQWRPEERELDRMHRPDRSAALKSAHEAKAYTDWAQEKVATSLADPAPSVAHDPLMKDAQAVIDAKRKQHAIKAAS